MSTSYNARVIYGFPYEPGDIPEEYKWEHDRYASAFGGRCVASFSAGHCGSDVEHLFGIEIVEIRDFTRGNAYVQIPPLVATPDQIAAVRKLATAMDKHPLSPTFYLVGDAG